MATESHRLSSWIHDILAADTLPILPEMDNSDRVKTNVLSWIIKISLINCCEIMERHVANHIISDLLSHMLDYN